MDRFPCATGLPVLSKSVARNHDRLSRGNNRCRENCRRSGVRSVAELNKSINVDHFGNLSERVYELYESLGIESLVLRYTGKRKPVAHNFTGSANRLNARGELIHYTYPDGTVVGRSYTHRGDLYQLTHAGTTIDTRVYDNGGRQTSSTLNNGVVETRAYNTDNTLTSISFGGSGTSIGNIS
jgi:hypothetical protein